MASVEEERREDAEFQQQLSGYLQAAGNKGVQLWVVGQLFGPQAWQFQGIFSAEEKAVAACVSHNYFVGPVTLDEALPHYPLEWPGCYFPKRT